jgi:hypothetical protein
MREEFHQNHRDMGRRREFRNDRYQEPPRDYRNGYQPYVSPDPSCLPVPNFGPPVPHPPPNQCPGNPSNINANMNAYINNRLWADLFKNPPPNHVQSEMRPSAYKSQNKKWVNPNFAKP